MTRAIPLAFLLLAAACTPPASPNPADLAVPVAPIPDLATRPDLTLPPLPCTPDCDAGQCAHSCRDTHGTPAPDLIPLGLRAEWDGLPLDGRLLELCIYNAGESTAPAGIPITFYFSPMRSPLATVQTNQAILPGATTRITWHWMNPPGSEGHCTIWAVVDDDGTGNGVVGECTESNNRSDDADPHLCGPG